MIFRLIRNNWGEHSPVLKIETMMTAINITKTGITQMMGRNIVSAVLVGDNLCPPVSSKNHPTAIVMPPPPVTLKRGGGAATRRAEERLENVKEITHRRSAERRDTSRVTQQ
ncbi:MAG: hypothetical protein ACNYPF_00375 [Candidatus Puniceispirillales bacterium WSBS_2018_MAG_OTU23]